MSSQTWISRTESGLVVQSGSLAFNVAGNYIELQIPLAASDDLTDLANEYSAAVKAKDDALAAARAAVRAAKDKRAALVTQMQLLNRLVQANPNVSDGLKENVGFPVYRRPSRGEPVTPTDLRVSVEGQATLFLRWNRAGNPASARFTIETRVGTTGWTQLTTTTASRYRFSTGTPGIPTLFRVFAERNGMESAPSTQAGAWQNNGSGEESADLTIAA